MNLTLVGMLLKLAQFGGHGRTAVSVTCSFRFLHLSSLVQVPEKEKQEEPKVGWTEDNEWSWINHLDLKDCKSQAIPGNLKLINKHRRWICGWISFRFFFHIWFWKPFWRIDAENGNRTVAVHAKHGFEQESNSDPLPTDFFWFWMSHLRF